MDDKLVTIHDGVYLHDAEFVKSVLEAEGGGIRVQVAKRDAERAAATLGAVLDRPGPS